MKFKGIELNGTYKVRCYATSFEFYNEKGIVIYFEDSYGYWIKREFDEKGNEIYCKDSNGKIIFNSQPFGERVKDDERVKELTIEEIEELLGYKIKIKGERK